MKVTFLGTGTSTGVPQLGCGCPVCTSTDSRDRRWRTSALVETRGRRFLIDAGPDFYHQMLRAGTPSLDALLITHSHYDHVGGIDDMRPYCAAVEGGFSVYCQEDVERDLRARVPYCFATHLYPGVPTFNITQVRAGEEFDIDGVKILPLRVGHYKLQILGYRIGRMAYITDAKTLPETTKKAVKGIDTLVINALRHKEHMSHFTVAQAMDVIRTVAPRRAYLIHASHEIGLHSDMEHSLPAGVELAYDMLTIEVPD